jgi:hypothetical protein
MVFSRSRDQNQEEFILILTHSSVMEQIFSIINLYTLIKASVYLSFINSNACQN